MAHAPLAAHQAQDHEHLYAVPPPGRVHYVYSHAHTPGLVGPYWHLLSLGKEGGWSAHTHQDVRLGPSWVLVLLNALEISVEESPLALEMFLHGEDNRPETWLKNSLFSPQNRPPRGTAAWETLH